MKSNFKPSLRTTLKEEGGWANHPRDPGGATMKGVTRLTYSRFLGHWATDTELRNIPDIHLEAIYKRGYWDLARADDLPNGMDLSVFDFAVNSGPGRAAQYLQRMVGVPADGWVGPKTLTALDLYVTKHGLAGTIKDYNNRRLGFLKHLKTWSIFGRGWGGRVARVTNEALQLAAE